MNETELPLDSASGILLTPEGYARLQQELDHLTSVKRPEIADRIRESQQHGEFSEDNSELDEVKFEQAIVENRISDLQALFGSAQVLQPNLIPTDAVGIGSLVTLEDQTFDDEFTVRLVSSIEADPTNDTISIESPMGTAIFGHQAGEIVSFQAPDGIKSFKILRIER